MATMKVADKDGTEVNIEKPLAPGRAAAGLSRPVVLAEEDKASVDAITTTLGGKLDTIHTDLSVTIAGYVDGLETLAATQGGLIGAVTETAPASDTASSGLNGRLQRIAQRLTSLIALVPAALTAAGNFKVSLQERVFSSTKLLSNANVSMSASGENVVVAATSLQTIRVFRGCLVAAGAVTLTVKDAAAGTVLATIPMTAGQAFAFDCEANEPLWISALSGAFVISLSGAVAVSGFVQYVKS